MEHGYDLLASRKPVKIGTAKAAGRGNMVEADIGKAAVYSGAAVIVGGVHPSGCSCFHCFKKTGALVGGSRLNKPKEVIETNTDKFGTEGETLWPLKSAADIARLARLVESERVAHSHALNDRSSRSHCLIRVNCTKIDKAGKKAKRVFLFVDLAGSERISKSGVTGAMQ